MRVFLHLHECGVVISDHEGADVADLDTALASATKAAREIMGAEVAEGRLCLSCCIVIEDENASEIGRVPFHDALAVKGL
jgi:hypothetical protein